MVSINWLLGLRDTTFEYGIHTKTLQIKFINSWIIVFFKRNRNCYLSSTLLHTHTLKYLIYKSWIWKSTQLRERTNRGTNLRVRVVYICLFSSSPVLCVYMRVCILTCIGLTLCYLERNRNCIKSLHMLSWPIWTVWTVKHYIYGID